VPFESLGAVSYSPSIVTMAVFVAVCKIFSVKEWHDLENQIRGRSRSLIMAPFDRPAGHSMSLKLVPFESLDAVSYSPSIVTVAESVAVCEIFNVKEWRHLKNQVRGRSRSLKMAPFDRPYTTFYWSAIVNIALSCTIFELFDVE